jgi:hypothetical protein
MEVAIALDRGPPRSWRGTSVRVHLRFLSRQWTQPETGFPEMDAGKRDALQVIERSGVLVVVVSTGVRVWR